MKGIIEYNHKKYRIDWAKPFDISIPMRSGVSNPNAFGIPHPQFEPIRVGDFVGSVALGGSVNCENLLLNAHGNGTHTECVGHISKERITINQCLRQFHLMAQVITVTPTASGQDWLVTQQAVEAAMKGNTIEALLIRTLPNDEAKKLRQYSGNNPAYLEASLCQWLREIGVKHLLIDLPSVDREEDAGALAAHHAFWNYPQTLSMDATITEMIYLPDSVADGIYVLNLQIASLETDASPSKPVLYNVEQI